MKCTVLLVFSRCFHCIFTAETFTFVTFHLYIKIHMYHIFYMKCTVLLVFSCVFTMFSLQKHVLLIHFTCLPKYTCTIYSTWNALFCLCFHVFLLCFHCRNMYFRYISNVYKNTNVPYILHEMHSFASVFMCFHCVFTAETFTFGTFQCIYQMHMYHIFNIKCTALLVFSCVFTVFSLQKHELLVHFTWIYQNTHVPYILHELHGFASAFTVFSLCFHCVFIAETCTFGTYHIYILKYKCTMYST
jgi:hypothetical protein